MIAALALAMIAIVPEASPAGRVAALAQSQGFQGEILVATGGKVVLDHGFGTAVPGTSLRARQPSDFRPGDIWRFASVTKQIVAAITMQEVAAGRIALDAPVTRYLPGFKGPTGSKIAVRQLLRHESGLPNPDADPATFTPSFKGQLDPLTGVCAGPVRDAPGASFDYNNCDYIVAGRLLEAVTHQPLARLVATRIAGPVGARSLAVAGPARQGFVDGKPEPAVSVAAYAGAASLTGTLADLWRFDQALIDGKLLPAAARAQMWDGQPKLGFAALGGWVFSVPLRGCKDAVRIVERRGQIGGVQVRNFILPDRNIVVIAATNRAETDFGEVWMGSGLSYELLSNAACEFDI
ncbi:serine hydrolase domain-containing protein [Sandarakinorhabdus sp.]|uniref:serine hydrolase domain-containing protein n=1 Tax=Sandarakinorhabdus sp. TaxID=1916663 RepID=UPI00286DBE0E|nr:serine hydrolase domain-containing protein [Sandarakinorhabdus sp.]